MTYRPERKNMSAVFLSIFCFVFSVIAFYIAHKIGLYMWVYQVAAIILAVFALQIFLKYVQSDYVYKADEHDLKIYKITGDKSVCVCSLNYEESISGVMTAEYAAKNKNNYPQTKIALNFCKNIFPNEYSLYYFNFNGKASVLKFEPDEIFTNFVNEKISAAKRAVENEENDYE